MNTDGFKPRAWRAADAERDESWVQRLSAEAADGFEAALRWAKAAGKPLLAMTAADFPLNGAARHALDQAVAATQDRWGMCLLKGFPMAGWSEDDARLAYWGMGLHMGVARPQNRASEIINNVRDEGGDYKVKGGRGYNTNAGLDFHQDSCDVVGLLCRRTAKAGGESKIVSSMAVAEEVARRRPDLIEVLKGAFHHSYQGAQDPSQPPYYRCPILGDDDAPFAMRTNRKNIVAAQRDFPEVPRLTPRQIEALDLLDEIMTDPSVCFSMWLEQGDLQLLGSYVTLHSRTPFEDHADPDLKRHLFRLWLAIPASQPLPSEWETYFGDVRAGAVRGGVRGSAITEAFVDYERRQAAALGMMYRPWTPRASALAQEQAHGQA